MAVDFVAGAVGFTYTWNPSAGQPGMITTLTGATCKMIVQQGAYRAVFAMDVSADGTTASYTTQAATDFPNPGQYSISFQATGSELSIETAAVVRTIGSPL